MRHHCRIDQRGMALPIAILALLVLTTLVTAYLALGAFEPQVSANLSDSTRVRYVAEAGIEFGFNSLAATTNWTNLLVTNNGVLANATPMPGLTSASGTYTVTLRNDVCAVSSSCNALGDTALTGVALDTGNQNGSGAADTNNVVIMTAVATRGTATKTITVVVQRVQLPPINAALSFPGTEADTSFTGTTFDIKGTDTNIDDSAGSASPVLGIAVSSTAGSPPGSNEAKVEATVAASQQSRIVGKNQSAAGTTTGNGTIAADATLTQSSITKFINDAKANADIVIDSTQSSPSSFTGIGSSCASNFASNTCWGTSGNPKIVYIRGTPPDPSSLFTALNVNGPTTGAGILIVEDGDFRINGDFRWEGILIVTGQYVGLGFLGGGTAQNVYGAVIVNETATDEAPGFREGVITGNGNMFYSKQALDIVQNSRRSVRMYSWRES